MRKENRWNGSTEWTVFTWRTSARLVFVSGKQSIPIGLTVEFGHCASGRSRNAGPFQCKVAVNMIDGDSPRDAGSAGFSCVEICVHLHPGISLWILATMLVTNIFNCFWSAVNHDRTMVESVHVDTWLIGISALNTTYNLANNWANNRAAYSPRRGIDKVSSTWPPFRGATLVLVARKYTLISPFWY